jgi:Hg(II)-responsive transcriptional regulator
MTASKPLDTIASRRPDGKSGRRQNSSAIRGLPWCQRQGKQKWLHQAGLFSLDSNLKCRVQTVRWRTIMAEEMTIGQLAKRAGVGVPTLRFYERKGLVAPPARRASGYRLYDREAELRVRFIRQAQELGFSLFEVSELLALRRNKSGSCADVRAKAAQKIAAIDAKLKNLRQIRRALSELVDACPGDAPRAECPILEALEPRS